MILKTDIAIAQSEDQKGYHKMPLEPLGALHMNLHFFFIFKLRIASHGRQ